MLIKTTNSKAKNMHPLDPFVRQEMRRHASSECNKIRNKLFIQGRGFDGRLSQAKKHYESNKSEQNKLELAIAIGEVEAYVNIRYALAPDVGLDNLTSGLKFKVRIMRDDLMHSD